MWQKTLGHQFLFTKPSDLIILTLIGVGVNILDLRESTSVRERNRIKEKKEPKPLIHYLTSLYAQKSSSSGSQQWLKSCLILTCAGVGTVAVAEAGVLLGVTGVDAVEGWGLEPGTGWLEQGLTAVWTGVRWAGFGGGISPLSTLFSWRATLRTSIS